MPFVCGLDLGQSADFTALSAVEATPGVDERNRPAPSFAVRHLRRWQLGTPYKAIATELRTLFEQPPLRSSPVAVDTTGVGAGVFELLQLAQIHAWLIPVVITAGHAVTGDWQEGYGVPKKELVSALQVPLQNHRFAIAPVPPESDLLAKELSQFRVKVTAAGNETFQSWRERDHDDLVLGTALAVWLAGQLGVASHPGTIQAGPAVGMAGAPGAHRPAAGVTRFGSAPQGVFQPRRRFGG